MTGIRAENKGCRTTESGVEFFKTRKEVFMRKKLFLRSIHLLLIFLILLPLSSVDAMSKLQLVGRETLNFTLPSTQDRLINYADEYYGKYHLIITFFPAAFTPV